MAGELVEDLGFPIEELDAVYRFDREEQVYVVSTWYDDRWHGPAPIIRIGESFWVQKGKAAVWTVEFELNP